MPSERLAEPDAAVLTRAQAGDLDAFEQLYRLGAGRVQALVRRLVGGRAGASRVEELVQDVFVAAWHALGTYRAEAPFQAWLRGVALNVLRAELRARMRREARVELAGDALERAAAAEEHGVGVRLDLEAAIETLPAGARAVFVLHDVEGCVHAEVAERLGISVGTSKSQLSRARTLLREVLQ